MSYDLGVRFVTAGKQDSGNAVRFGSRRVRLVSGWIRRQSGESEGSAGVFSLRP